MSSEFTGKLGDFSAEYTADARHEIWRGKLKNSARRPSRATLVNAELPERNPAGGKFDVEISVERKIGISG